MENLLVKNKKNILPYLFVISIFLIVTGSNLLSKSMFMDGIIYSSIAKNLFLGECSVWNLKFTDTVISNFHEHPPLSMLLQSFFFKIFGTNLVVDKIFSLSTYFFSALILIRIWKLINPFSKIAWIVVLFWILTPIVFWASTNNMLENFLTVFILTSFYFILKYIYRKKVVNILFSGVFLGLAFLTKGFVALFPLSFFFIYFLFIKEYKLKRVVIDTLLLLLSVILPLFLLFYLNDNAYDFIINYLEVQVLKSIKSVTTVDSRFFIIKRLFSELLVMFFLLIVIAISFHKKIKYIHISNKSKQMFLLFFIFALTGVLPILITLKQSGFYVLSTYPFFAISFVLLFKDKLDVFDESLTNSKAFYLITFCLFCVGMLFVKNSFNTYGKDNVLIKDIELISQVLPEGHLVGASSAKREDWTTHAYFYRINLTSIDCSNQSFNNKYFIRFKNDFLNDSLLKNFKIIPLKTKEMFLYAKK